MPSGGGADATSATTQLAASDPTGGAVRRVQLWAQAVREEQLAWEASATTTGETCMALLHDIPRSPWSYLPVTGMSFAGMVSLGVGRILMTAVAHDGGYC